MAFHKADNVSLKSIDNWVVGGETAAKSSAATQPKWLLKTPSVNPAWMPLKSSPSLCESLSSLGNSLSRNVIIIDCLRHESIVQDDWLPLLSPSMHGISADAKHGWKIVSDIIINFDDFLNFDFAGNRPNKNFVKKVN